MGGEREIETEGFCCDVEKTVFVAVGKNVKESKSTLLWALQSFAGKNLCLLHVHQPAHLVSLMDGKFSVKKLTQHAVNSCRDLELQKMHEVLNQYILILTQVQAGKVWIEMDNVEKGIVHIISQHNIRWLVMGAAADKNYSKKLLKLKSRKALFVCQQAPASCHIWFVCKSSLIYTRSVNASSCVGSIVALSSPTNTGGKSLLQSCADVDDDELEGVSRRFTFQCMVHSIRSTDKVVGNLEPAPLPMDVMSGDCLPFPLLYKSQDNLHQLSSAILLEEKSQEKAACEIYDKLEHAMLDAENSKQKAFEESVRRWKAEEDAMEAMHKAEASESLCMKEINQRKELEEVLARQRQELETMKNQHDQFVKQLQMVQEQKLVLESRVTESHRTEEELEEKIIQAVDLLVTFKGRRDEMQIEHANAIREVNALRNLVAEDAASLCRSQFLSLSFLEINEATHNFDPSWKIGDGRYGSVYKGFLHHMKVAIKMLPSRGSQGHMEFEQEAGLLSRVRHPNIVTLIGTCPESRSLIYEYLENGSLEDRLACCGKTPPLPWQTRTKIASEICSALIFLHSDNPCIIHGNLKPTKILLDSKFVSKLSDLGICHLIAQDGNLTYTSTLCNKTNPEVSVYMDPEFLETRELTAESDVYSFGIILLRLLTGRPALGIVKDVKCALERDNLKTVLDFSAGPWPLEQAQQLAHLALRCCERKRLDRPDLVSDVWGVIEPMRDLCTLSYLDSKEHRRVPSHFVCPIFQDIMNDPHIAADGFTYEADAIKGWLNSGHKTSPMTNLKLEHCDLLPNFALYNTIQEWLQQS
ncbi:U-box domain-containing protein 32 isoform X2 [Cornus florida]|uniref:U-box domain-containing protein 32 isoform X2 n=1 Tax=Cornus florida TaxID=4283 RepID=UPI0028983ADA|nr:U-box domain-containing protein 32 isoform X2 [Cornus florida]